MRSGGPQSGLVHPTLDPHAKTKKIPKIQKKTCMRQPRREHAEMAKGTVIGKKMWGRTRQGSPELAGNKIKTAGSWLREKIQGDAAPLHRRQAVKFPPFFRIYLLFLRCHTDQPITRSWIIE